MYVFFLYGHSKLSLWAYAGGHVVSSEYQHYRAELPVGGVSFDRWQIEKPLAGLHCGIARFVVKTILTHPLDYVKRCINETLL